MKKLNFVVIGATGVIGQNHIAGVIENKGLAKLAGICDVNKEKCCLEAKKLKVKSYFRLEDVLREKDVDVVTLATPHPLHAEQTVAAFQAGKHVLCEKPMAVTVEEADRMIAASKKTGRKLGICFQLRLNPYVKKAKELIDKEKIGRIYRTYAEIGSLKTAAYYNSAPWRGTWLGEGGGFLINNAPHLLDTLFYLVGPPKKIWGISRTQLQDTEVDDAVSAMFEYPDGGQGAIMANCNQLPAITKWEIYGDKGNILLKPDSIQFFKHNEMIHEVVKRKVAKHAGSGIVSSEKKIKVLSGKFDHALVIKNFCKAVAGKEKMLCSGEEGIKSLEIINAITYSSYAGEEVALPLNRKKYRDLFDKLKKMGPKAKHIPLQPSPIKN